MATYTFDSNSSPNSGSWTYGPYRLIEFNFTNNTGSQVQLTSFSIPVGRSPSNQYVVGSTWSGSCGSGNPTVALVSGGMDGSQVSSNQIISSTSTATQVVSLAGRDSSGVDYFDAPTQRLSFTFTNPPIVQNGSTYTFCLASTLSAGSNDIAITVVRRYFNGIRFQAGYAPVLTYNAYNPPSPTTPEVYISTGDTDISLPINGGDVSTTLNVSFTGFNSAITSSHITVTDVSPYVGYSNTSVGAIAANTGQGSFNVTVLYRASSISSYGHKVRVTIDNGSQSAYADSSTIMVRPAVGLGSSQQNPVTANYMSDYVGTFRGFPSSSSYDSKYSYSVSGGYGSAISSGSSTANPTISVQGLTSVYGTYYVLNTNDTSNPQDYVPSEESDALVIYCKFNKPTINFRPSSTGGFTIDNVLTMNYEGTQSSGTEFSPYLANPSTISPDSSLFNMRYYIGTSTDNGDYVSNGSTITVSEGMYLRGYALSAYPGFVSSDYSEGLLLPVYTYPRNMDSMLSGEWTPSFTFVSPEGETPLPTSGSSISIPASSGYVRIDFSGFLPTYNLGKFNYYRTSVLYDGEELVGTSSTGPNDPTSSNSLTVELPVPYYGIYMQVKLQCGYIDSNNNVSYATDGSNEFTTVEFKFEPQQSTKLPTPTLQYNVPPTGGYTVGRNVTALVGTNELNPTASLPYIPEGINPGTDVEFEYYYGDESGPTNQILNIVTANTGTYLYAIARYVGTSPEWTDSDYSEGSLLPVYTYPRNMTSTYSNNWEPSVVYYGSSSTTGLPFSSSSLVNITDTTGLIRVSWSAFSDDYNLGHFNLYHVYLLGNDDSTLYEWSDTFDEGTSEITVTINNSDLSNHIGEYLRVRLECWYIPTIGGGGGEELAPDGSSTYTTAQFILGDVPDTSEVLVPASTNANTPSLRPRIIFRVSAPNNQTISDISVTVNRAGSTTVYTYSGSPSMFFSGLPDKPSPIPSGTIVDFTPPISVIPPFSFYIVTTSLGSTSEPTDTYQINRVFPVSEVSTNQSILSTQLTSMADAVYSLQEYYANVSSATLWDWDYQTSNPYEVLKLPFVYSLSALYSLYSTLENQYNSVPTRDHLFDFTKVDYTESSVTPQIVAAGNYDPLMDEPFTVVNGMYSPQGNYYNFLVYVITYML